MQSRESAVGVTLTVLGMRAALQARVREAVRRVVVTFVSLGLVLLAPGAPMIFTVHAQSEATGAASTRLDSLFAAYEAYAGAIDPVMIDVEELAFELAFETPDAIAGWVTSNIAYHPYHGLLRGPTGTLLALGGNSLDQAVLLAKLLFDAGFEAKVAYTDVPESRKSELWQQVSASATREMPSLPPSSVFEDDALLTETLVSDAQAQLQTAAEDLEATFEREQSALESLLQGDGAMRWDDAEIPEHLLEGSYAWVEVRVTPDAAWERMHPVFSSPPTWLDELEPVSTITDSVPTDLQHRLRFQVIIEQRLGGNLEEKPITDAWEQPVANLVGRSFTFASMPDSLSDESQPLNDLDAAFDSANFIYPMFNNALAPGGQLFDLNGNTAPPDAGANPAAGIFQSVGNALGDAVGGLTGEEESVALTAQWLEFTLVEPGGDERVYRRAIFDRIGADHRLTGSTDMVDSVTTDDVVKALQSSHSFMVDPGMYPVQFVQRMAADRMLEHEPYLRKLFNAGPSENLADMAPPTEYISTIVDFEHLRQFLTFDARATPTGTISYRNKPALSLISKSWDESWEMTDVIQNDRVSLERASDDTLRLAPRNTHAMGLWETVTEGVVLSDSDERFSVPTYMQAAREQGVPFTIIDANSATRLDGIEVPTESKEAMRSDLEHGYVVVSPTQLPDGMSRAAWWRVDPRTGVTLGRGFDGRGVIEGLNYITTSGLVISFVLGIAGMASCMGGGGSGSCCLQEGIGWFAVGFALGAAIGMVGGALGLSQLAAANLGFGMGAAFDFATFNMGLAGIIPSGCTPSRLPNRIPVLLADDRELERGACDMTPILRVYFQNAVGVPGT